MFLTKKISEKVVAVVETYPVSISLRESGKEHIGKEEVVCTITNGRFVIRKDIADKYGLSIVFE